MLKAFQKGFQSDSVTILEIQKKKKKLLDRLKACETTILTDGWERLFLNKIENKTDETYLLSHKLVINVGGFGRILPLTLTPKTRESTVRMLIKNINTRLDFGIDIQDKMRPLAATNSEISDESIKSCFDFIARDYDEDEFYSEYITAVQLFENKSPENPIDILKELNRRAPDQFMILKAAIARVIAAKPHSADVERLISKISFNYFTLAIFI